MVEAAAAKGLTGFSLSFLPSKVSRARVPHGGRFDLQSGCLFQEGAERHRLFPAACRRVRNVWHNAASLAALWCGGLREAFIRPTPRKPFQYETAEIGPGASCVQGPRGGPCFIGGPFSLLHASQAALESKGPLNPPGDACVGAMWRKESVGCLNLNCGFAISCLGIMTLGFALRYNLFICDSHTSILYLLGDVSTVIHILRVYNLFYVSHLESHESLQWAITALSRSQLGASQSA